MSSKTVLVVSYYPFLSDTRALREARALASHGFAVRVLCTKEEGRPNRETVDGIEVRRLPLHKYRGDSYVKYVLTYAFFSLLVFLTLSVYCIKGVPKYVHVHTMPDVLVFSAIVPKMLGAKVVLDIRDSMPELCMEKFGFLESHWLVRLLIRIERLAVWFADKTIAVHLPHLKLLRKHGVNTNKVAVVMNTPECRTFKPQTVPFSAPGAFTLGFHGTISRRFGLDKVLEVVSMLRNEIPGLRLKLVGGGDYIEQIRSKIKKLQIDDVVETHLRMVNAADLPRILSDVCVGVSSYELGPATKTMLPAKMLEYIAMGKPVITVRNPAIEYYFPDGTVVYYDGTKESLINAIRYTYKNPAEVKKRIAACARILSKYSWTVQAHNLLKVFDTNIPALI